MGGLFPFVFSKIATFNCIFHLSPKKDTNKQKNLLHTELIRQRYYLKNNLKTAKSYEKAPFFIDQVDEKLKIIQEKQNSASKRQKLYTETKILSISASNNHISSVLEEKLRKNKEIENLRLSNFIEKYKKITNRRRLKITLKTQEIKEKRIKSLEKYREMLELSEKREQERKNKILEKLHQKFTTSKAILVYF